ncbi:MAG: glycosyltransferase family 2 protein [Candidatus Nanopelagicales bacterium]|nr:glycosyltransferase family 2 protein [Candidatus Nanopelagicales bacterium]
MALRLAALLTSFNRKPQTLACLGALQSQGSPEREISIFLTDDGSTDGTADAVLAAHPEAVVIHGDGQLYWAGGMALADQAASRTDPDYFMWLNDDTILDPEALDVMFEISDEHPGAIVVAATRDPATSILNYGGRLRLGAHPQKFRPAGESDQVQEVDAFNGNCVLVPRAVRRRVGPIDGDFPHAYADDDYSLRADELGIKILQAPGTLANCPSNPPGPRSGRFVPAWRDLQSPKGLPWRGQVRYLKRHGDWRWPFWLVAGQAKRVVRRRV